MTDLIRKARVIMTALATWLTAAVVLFTTIAPELPEDWQTWTARAIVWLTAAVAFIRRHTPVSPSARGVLPQVHGR